LGTNKKDNFFFTPHPPFCPVGKIGQFFILQREFFGPHPP
jgi:hypothetical protein